MLGILSGTMIHSTIGSNVQGMKPIVMQNPSELVPRQEPPDASSDKTVTNSGNTNSEQSRHIRNKDANDFLFSVNKITRGP